MVRLKAPFTVTFAVPDVRFNSKMVRLKVVSRQSGIFIILSFNSKMVRLKVQVENMLQ